MKLTESPRFAGKPFQYGVSNYNKCLITEGYNHSCHSGSGHFLLAGSGIRVEVPAMMAQFNQPVKTSPMVVFCWLKNCIVIDDEFNFIGKGMNEILYFDITYFGWLSFVHKARRSG